MVLTGKKPVIISAMALNRTIGRDGKIPWKLPEDMKRFRKMTLGNTVIMGRKTAESIGRPLDGRTNIVLSTDLSFSPKGYRVCRSFEETLDAIDKCVGTPYVIGGSKIYGLFLPLCDRLELTRLWTTVAGDSFFPPIDFGDWEPVECVDMNDKTWGPYSFITYERIKRGSIPQVNG